VLKWERKMLQEFYGEKNRPRKGEGVKSVLQTIVERGTVSLKGKKVERKKKK